MIYVLLLLSLTANGVLIWYIRTLIKKYLFDVETVEKFADMVGQYADALKSLYKLEEFYGEEIIKKAITQTQFVIDACGEFKSILVEEESNTEEEQTEEKRGDERVIKLKDGEKVSQDAANYKRVVAD